MKIQIEIHLNYVFSTAWDFFDNDAESTTTNIEEYVEKSTPIETYYNEKPTNILEVDSAFSYEIG